MFNKLAVEGYFNFVKSVIPQKTLLNPDGFFFLPNNIYDPTLDFDNELKSYLVENNEALQLSVTPWIAIVWNRGVLGFNPDGLNQRHSNILNRDISNPLEPKGTINKFKQSSCPIEVIYYSNSLDYLELLEEYIHVFLKDITAFDTIFPVIDNIKPTKIAVKDFTIEEFTKDDRVKEGEICKLVTSLDLCYPVDIADNLGIRKLIGKGKINITYKLMSQTENYPII